MTSEQNHHSQDAQIVQVVWGMEISPPKKILDIGLAVVQKISISHPVFRMLLMNSQFLMMLLHKQEPEGISGFQQVDLLVTTSGGEE